MIVTFRLTDDEKVKFDTLKQSTGLSTTELIKKRLFDNTENGMVSKNILGELGRISTSVNRAKLALNCDDYTSVQLYLDTIEREVGAIWQS